MTEIAVRDLSFTGLKQHCYFTHWLTQGRHKWFPFDRDNLQYVHLGQPDLASRVSGGHPSEIDMN